MSHMLYVCCPLDPAWLWCSSCINRSKWHRCEICCNDMVFNKEMDKWSVNIRNIWQCMRCVRPCVSPRLACCFACWSTQLHITGPFVWNGVRRMCVRVHMCVQQLLLVYMSSNVTLGCITHLKHAWAMGCYTQVDTHTHTHTHLFYNTCKKPVELQLLTTAAGFRVFKWSISNTMKRK